MDIIFQHHLAQFISNCKNSNISARGQSDEIGKSTVRILSQLCLIDWRLHRQPKFNPLKSLKTLKTFMNLKNRLKTSATEVQPSEVFEYFMNFMNLKKTTCKETGLEVYVKIIFKLKIKKIFFVTFKRDDLLHKS